MICAGLDQNFILIAVFFVKAKPNFQIHFCASLILIVEILMIFAGECSFFYISTNLFWFIYKPEFLKLLIQRQTQIHTYTFTTIVNCYYEV